jgi:hypothetical protein
MIDTEVDLPPVPITPSHESVGLGTQGGGGGGGGVSPSSGVIPPFTVFVLTVPFTPRPPVPIMPSAIAVEPKSAIKRIRLESDFMEVISYLLFFNFFLDTLYDIGFILPDIFPI